ncbi:MAG: flavin reductase family protein [Bacteroidetes bacterium]|jgi:flavin reductase (DIM6/NTAB) family NADH-FMN oxidoreductase RutF|nr:flavin reductase family protein [Bacteroidota bacterium]
MARHEHTSFDPASLNPGDLHAKLLGGIAPRPIAFASTIDADGRPNLAPFSYFNVFSAQPPVVIFSPARRLRDNTTKHTLDNVKEVAEVVINLVDFAMVHQCSLASSDFPEGVSEFEKTGLTPEPSDLIRPFRVAESPVQLECKVLRVDSLGEQGGAGQLVICEVLRMHFRKDVLNEKGHPDPQKLDLVGRCGGSSYVRASGDALFDLPKPISAPGIGVDALPKEVRESSLLTGNNLAQLGALETWPNETDVNDFKLLELSDLFIEHENNGVELERALHRYAAEQIDQGHPERAIKALLAFNPG